MKNLIFINTDNKSYTHLANMTQRLLINTHGLFKQQKKYKNKAIIFFKKVAICFHNGNAMSKVNLG